MEPIEQLIAAGNYQAALEQLDIESKNLPEHDSSVSAAHIHRLMDLALWPDRKSDALKEGEVAYQLFLKNNEQVLATDLAIRLSLNHLIVGNYPLGLEHGQDALRLATALNDSLKMLTALTRISISHHDLGNYDLGIQYGKRAITLQSRMTAAGPNEFLEAYAVTAINFDDKGDLDSAIFYHRKILAVIDQVTKESRVPMVYNNLGNSLLKKGEHKEARGLFLKNLSINKSLHKTRDRSYDLATVLTNLGTVSYKLGQYSTAISYLDSAEHYAHQSEDVEKMYDVYYQKFLFFDLINRDQEAITYLLKYNQLRDSLQNAQTKAAMAKLEIGFATREKENQLALQSIRLQNQEAEIKRNYLLLALAIVVIVLLIVVFALLRHRSQRKQELLIKEKDIALREAQISAAIASQETERIRFARDLHDSFGQMISVLNVNLKTLEEKQNKTSEKRDFVYENCAKVIDNMYDELRSICFDLMPQTLIIHGLPAALKEFAVRINAAGIKKIHVEAFDLDERLQEIQEISLFRIAQEWTNNILKHSNADTISIQLIKEPQAVILTIEDNGAGFDPGLLKHSNGNGWKNIQTRAKLIKGEVILETRPGVRTSTLMVEIPFTAAVNGSTSARITGTKSSSQARIR